MYVLIDMNQCAITHKHSNREVLAALSWIECLNASKTLPLGNPKLFQDDLTPLEMQKIYKAATGAELKCYANHMASILHDVAKRMPESDVVAAEVEAQRKYVMPADRSPYLYAKGCKVPEERPSLYPRPSLKVERDEDAEKRATIAYSAYVPPAPIATDSSAPTPAAAALRPPAVPRAPGAVRTGSVKETIFNAANEMWAKAGSPTDPKTVMDLRKAISTFLQEQMSINKSTANTQLWIWHKEKFG